MAPHEADFVIGGYLYGKRECLNSLLVGLYNDHEELVYVGQGVGVLAGRA